MGFYACRFCGKQGHNARTCPEKAAYYGIAPKPAKVAKLASNGGRRVCSVCGQVGHNSRTCKQTTNSTISVVKPIKNKKNLIAGKIVFNTVPSKRGVCSYCQSPYHSSRNCFVKTADTAMYTRSVNSLMKLAIRKLGIGLGAIGTSDYLYVNVSGSYNSLKVENPALLLTGINVVQVRNVAKGVLLGGGYEQYRDDPEIIGTWLVLDAGSTVNDVLCSVDSDGQLFSNKTTKLKIPVDSDGNRSVGDVEGVIALIDSYIDNVENIASFEKKDEKMLDSKPEPDLRRSYKNREWRQNQGKYYTDKIAVGYSGRLLGFFDRTVQDLLKANDPVAKEFAECAAYWKFAFNNRPSWGWDWKSESYTDEIRYNKWIKRNDQEQ